MPTATSATLSDYALMVENQQFDVVEGKMVPGHYVNELPEDFVFQTMRLAIQMRFFPSFLTSGDVFVEVVAGAAGASVEAIG